MLPVLCMIRESDRMRDTLCCTHSRIIDISLICSDDLAFDVGGSAACGAKTIYAELADKYEQTARHRFDIEEQPSWSTAPSNELKMRYEMSEAAKDKVDIRLHFLTRLPEAINAIVYGEPFD